MTTEASLIRQLDKRLVRASFDKAATGYDDVAALQREVGNNMLERLDYMRIDPAVILDVGAGTGYCASALNKRYKKSDILLLDIAPSMLKQARQKRSWFDNNIRRKHREICGDAESLPLADNSIDFLFSNLALQWCEDLEGTFNEFRRVLKPTGMLLFSTFGPDTLHELRSSWQAADSNTHVHNFIDMHDIGDILQHTGFTDPVMDVERYTLTYPDALQLMRELKTLGAHNVAQNRPHGLTGRQGIKRMTGAYEQHRREGLLPASYEVVFGHAWAPATEMHSPACSTVNVDFTVR